MSSLTCVAVFLTQIITRWQKNADAKVGLSISHWQKWILHRQYSKVVVNRLPLFKNLFDHSNRLLMV